MPRILVLYGTTDGHTAKVAAAIGDALREHSSDADVVDAAVSAPDVAKYDAVIVAASLHAGGYQRAVTTWVRASATALNLKPTALVTVCLGVLQHDPKVRRELQQIRERFLATTAWEPSLATAVAGALPYTRYNWVKRLMMRRIACKVGGDTDIRRDFEYTDWNGLRAFAVEFAESLAPAPTPDAAARQRRPWR